MQDFKGFNNQKTVKTSGAKASFAPTSYIFSIHQIPHRSFNKYVDRILSFFDHPPTPCRQT